MLGKMFIKQEQQLKSKSRTLSSYRWCEKTTRELVMLVKNETKGQFELFEKPICRVFYERIRLKSKELRDIHYTTMKSKMRYLRTVYASAASLTSSPDKTELEEYRRRRCPYYDILHSIFGQNFKIEKKEKIENVTVDSPSLYYQSTDDMSENGEALEPLDVSEVMEPDYIDDYIETVNVECEQPNGQDMNVMEDNLCSETLDSQNQEYAELRVGSPSSAIAIDDMNDHDYKEMSRNLSSRIANRRKNASFSHSSQELILIQQRKLELEAQKLEWEKEANEKKFELEKLKVQQDYEMKKLELRKEMRRIETQREVEMQKIESDERIKKYQIELSLRKRSY